MFIHSRLDCCNGMLSTLTNSLHRLMQLKPLNGPINGPEKLEVDLLPWLIMMLGFLILIEISGDTGIHTRWHLHNCLQMRTHL